MNVCVYCGSSVGSRPEYADAAREFATALVRRGDTLVYGGGNVGLMGVIADAVLASGGRAIGVMPRHLTEREIAHTTLTELHVVETMHERKHRMASLADIFVLLPGGMGSWEEFCEALTWNQLGLHRKACGILNVSNYYTGFVDLAQHAVREGFLRSADYANIIVDDDPSRLLASLENAVPQYAVKWMPAAEQA